VGELAAVLSVSRGTLNRLVRAELGTTPSAILKQAQIDFAKRLIADTNANLASIALRAGFTESASFFRAFRRMENETPGIRRATKGH